LSKIFKGGSTATETFRYWTGGENDASIVIDDQGFLYVEDHYQPPNSRAEQVGQLMKLDPSKPANPVVWSVKENTTDYQGNAGFFSTPALVGDTLYASATGGDLMAVDAKTGKVYWRHPLTSPLWSGPVVIDNTLVIGDCSGTLYGFDVSNPKKDPKALWNVKLGGCIESTPAVWNGWIYIGTRAGYEYGLADPQWKKEQMKATPPVFGSPSPSVSPSP
jgi:outer membrane protein assembly factor BamB